MKRAYSYSSIAIVAVVGIYVGALFAVDGLVRSIRRGVW